MIIFGASGHGKVIYDILLAENKYNVECFVDDKPLMEILCDLPVYLTENKLIEGEDLVIAVGKNATRKKIVERLENVNYIIAKHPSSVLSKFTTIGEGTVIMPNVVVNSGSKIGKHVILNTGCIIEHDCEIHDFSHISPNAALAGNVIIGEGAHIGIGASIIQGMKIGKYATVGAGAVIIKDVPDFATVVGNPARVIKN